ncbi:MAG: hypothetical protein R3B95_16045 [Nitrospirales bacterium]|nr:hypothetical protein [Nitrospirales bacterium]
MKTLAHDHPSHRAHGAYPHQYHGVRIPQCRRRFLRGAIKMVVPEQRSQVQHYHPNVEVQQWHV